MALLAHWKLDDNFGKDTNLHPVDSSGHANNHDFSSSQFSIWSYGFWNHWRHSVNSDYHSGVANVADFRLTGDMTVMAWVKLNNLPTADEYIASCGLNDETSAGNVLWALLLKSSGAFGMLWEHGSGTDVEALSPTLQFPSVKGFPGLMHIAVVRSINGANRDVKFVKNGVDLAADVTGLTAPDGGGSGLVDLLRKPQTTTNVFDGALWNVRVYDTAESVANILAVYNAERPDVDRVEKTPPSHLPTVIGLEASAGYERVPMGSELDQVERPGSGWAEALA